ncbi:hypothetical protein N431DRAFT_462818 [Stipitochalara longipes BDJ]|nr:hypothetical protein N431DRAFT_462818 [Stipitochalara longipes BDJ]
MGLASGSRKRKICSAADEVINELRRTTKAQTQTISNQEELIQKLTRKLQEHGLDTSLLSEKNLTMNNNTSNFSPSSHAISPHSPPIAWEGTIKDLIPISMNGMEGRAMVLTEDIIDQWGTFLNIQFKVKKFLAEWDEDRAIMESRRKTTVSPQKIEYTETGRFFDGMPEKRVELEYTKSNERSHKLGRQIEEFESEMLKVHKKIGHRMRTILEKNKLRKRDDQQWMTRLRLSKLAKYEGSWFDPYIASDSEDSETS